MGFDNDFSENAAQEQFYLDLIRCGTRVGNLFANLEAIGWPTDTIIHFFCEETDAWEKSFGAAESAEITWCENHELFEEFDESPTGPVRVVEDEVEVADG